MGAETDRIPRLGDVVLMDARPSLNALQSIMRGRKARFSHAALAINDTAYVDSLAKGRIELRRWTELPNEMRIAVYRYRKTPDDFSQRLAAMLNHYGKGYNWAFAAKGSPVFGGKFADTLYCSEYVGEVYSHAELGLNKMKKVIAPADLEALADNPDWEDVTDIYRPYIDGSRKPLFEDGIDKVFGPQGEFQAAMRKSRPEVERASAKADALAAMMKDLTKQFADLAEAAKDPGGSRRK